MVKVLLLPCLQRGVKIHFCGPLKDLVGIESYFQQFQCPKHYIYHTYAYESQMTSVAGYKFQCLNFYCMGQGMVLLFLAHQSIDIH